MLAAAAVGERVLKRMQRLSAKYGTKIEMCAGIGVVRPSANH
jgi:hypothetical protein